MHTDKKNHFYLILSTVVVTVFVLLVSVVNDLTPGIGFGRDVKVLLATQDVNRLESELVTQNLYYNREWRIDEVSDSQYLLTISGVDNAEGFIDAMKQSYPELKVGQVSTFGSLTKLQNNQSFLSLYIISVLAMVGVYFAFRFKLVGTFVGFLVSVPIIVAIYTVNASGNAFTRSLWSLFLFVIIMSFMQKHIFVSRLYRLKVSPSTEKMYHFKVSLFPNIALLILSFLITFHMGSSTHEEIYFLVPFAISSIVLESFFIFYGFDFLESLMGISLPQVYRESRMFNNDNENKRTFLLANIALTIGAVLIFSSSLSIRPELVKSHDYASQQILMIPQSDSTTYLEVEAVLSRIGMFDKQVDYEVSEQGYLWIYFDDRIDAETLDFMSNTIFYSTGVKSNYFMTVSETFPVETVFFYAAFGLMLVYALIGQKFIFGNERMLLVALFNVLAAGIFVALASFRHIVWYKETFYMLGALPIIVMAFLGSKHRTLFYQSAESFEDGFIYSFSMVLYTIILISIPIFVVIPISMGIEMVNTYIVLMLSILLTTLILYSLFYLYKHFFEKGGKNNDDRILENTGSDGSENIRIDESD